jgi:salicylate hydroxylase
VSRPLKIVVVGGGLGGLTAANALAQAGFEVEVREQADRLGEVGAGVQVSPNALKVLRALGLEAGLKSVAFEPEAFVGRNWKSGRVLYRTPLKSQYTKIYGAGYYHVHRADLHDVLRRGLPPAALHLGSRCLGVTQRGSVAVAEFADGKSVEADVVIGADGIHSAVRASLFGPAQARFTGNMCWRGMVPIEALPPGLVEPMATNWLGPNGHVVHYFVRGGAFVNFVAVYETDAWAEESWSIKADRSELLSTYADWNERLLKVFAAAEHCFKWALYDRDPLPRWSSGRITLLGDAAHPMLPFLAQGAAMAIEDGFTIAKTLARRSDDPETALADYESLRLARTARVQLGARERAKTMHLRSPVARFRRDVGFFIQGLRNPVMTSHRAEWIFGHDVTV